MNKKGLKYGDTVIASEGIRRHTGKIINFEEIGMITFVRMKETLDDGYNTYVYDVGNVVSSQCNCGVKKFYSSHTERWFCPECDNYE